MLIMLYTKCKIRNDMWALMKSKYWYTSLIYDCCVLDLNDMASGVIIND